jgi:uncharacterized membrane protein YczE
MRGGAATRFADIVGASCVIAVGVVLLVQSRLGAAPWDVLNQGIARETPLSFAAANIATALGALVLARAFGGQIGRGSVANAMVVGVSLELLYKIDEVRGIGTGYGTAGRIGLLCAGTALIAVGSALYLSARLGAGPRDAPMLVLATRTNARLGALRGAIEITVAGTGVLLGARVGAGTALFAVAIGPAIEFTMIMLARSALTEDGGQNPRRLLRLPADRRRGPVFCSGCVGLHGLVQLLPGRALRRPELPVKTDVADARDRDLRADAKRVDASQPRSATRAARHAATDTKRCRTPSPGERVGADRARPIGP